MISPRIQIAALFLLIAGLVLGQVTDSNRVRPPLRVGEYWLLTGDFHVHAFPGDGALTAWDLRAEARRRGLDVIAITNHNQTVAARWGTALLNKNERPFVLIGQEITAPGYHMIAAGVNHTIDWDLPAAAAADSVHAHNGVAIAAHPVRKYWGAYAPAALARLDGTEVAHPEALGGVTREEVLDFFRRTRNGTAGIGSSDFHFAGPLGYCRTAILVREVTPAGVIEAIRAGRTVGYDPTGHAFGDPALVQLIGASSALPPAHSNLGQKIAVACAWIGMIGLGLMGQTGPKHTGPRWVKAGR